MDPIEAARQEMYRRRPLYDEQGRSLYKGKYRIDFDKLCDWAFFDQDEFLSNLPKSYSDRERSLALMKWRREMKEANPIISLIEANRGNQINIDLK